MISKSSHNSRKCWLEFTLELQSKSIIDSDGNIVHKRLVFDRLYSEDSQIQLTLVAAGMHSLYRIIDRKEFNEAIVRQQAIDEAIRDELHNRAVMIARRFNLTNFDETVKFMVEAMLHATEHHKEIDNAVKAKVK